MPFILPDMPPRIARLPKDERGYPVPRFVEWLKDGKRVEREEPGAKPDFRYADFEFRWRAFHNGWCWLCGERIGVHRVYVIGPMCVINHTTMEPACHRDCAEFAAKACPFLVRPRQKRNAKGLDEEASAPGTMLARNPGCVCLYETKEAKAFNDGKGGWLIRLGEPTRVDWWAEGRQATRAEIVASIDSGYPLLEKEAWKDGPGAIDDLARQAAVALKLLPAA
jgi:hypothetical protein